MARDTRLCPVLHESLHNPWIIDSIVLRRLGMDSKWFYVIEWKPNASSHIGDGISIPVLMTGHRVQMKVEPDDSAEGHISVP